MAATMALPTKYEYDQLPIVPQTTRLLHLKPASSGDAALQASLVYADITHDPPPDYEALSYVWGDSVFPELLHIDGNGTIAITANLSQCLVSLRKTDRTRVLWVDAVCIDQENDQEKEIQLAFMGKIYKNASRAVIWLGESSPSTESSMFNLNFLKDALLDDTTGNTAITYRDGKKFLLWPERTSLTQFMESSTAIRVHIVEAPQEAESFSFETGSGEEVNVHLGKRSTSPLPPNASPLDGFKLASIRASELLANPTDNLPLQRVLLREAAMFRFVGGFFGDEMFDLILRYGTEEVYTNPWFTRMWVVQEVCLAPKAVLLHRGCELDWQEFSMAMNLLSASVEEENRIVPAPASFQRACELVRSANLFKAAAISTNSEEQHLHFIARLSHTLRSQKCKFDHDRIYALLSLWPEQSPLKGIVPDYGKPVSAVFGQFSAQLLTLGMRGTLCDAGAWERRDLGAFPALTPDSLPTWAPDLRVESKNSRLPWLKHYFRQALASKTLTNPATAPIAVVETSRGLCLNIEVLVIGPIQASTSSPSFPSTTIYDPHKENSYDTVIKYIKHCRQLYKDYTNQAGYPISHELQDDPEFPFWATVVSYSKYTATPSALKGRYLMADGVQNWSRLFQKHCLDDGGVFSGPGKSAIVDVNKRREQVLKEMESKSQDRSFDAREALFMYDIIRFTLNRVRFIVTDNGFVGLTPPTQIFDCDLIVMIRGCRIPFILRPVIGTDSYTLVGSCYIFGLMDNIMEGNYKQVSIL